MRILIALFVAAQCWATTTLTITQPAVAKAGVSASITLTAVCTGPGIETFLWTNLSGPATGVFGSATTASTTFTAPVRGDYQVQVACTNSDGTSNTSAHVGSVLVDSNDVVITGASASVDAILGPLLRWGATTDMGSYYDIGDRAIADAIATAALANPPHLGTQLTGTVALDNSGALVGTGTLFTTETPPGTPIIVTWSTVDGAQTGRLADTVYTVTNNTHAQLSTFNNQIDAGSGFNFYLQPADTAIFQPFWWGQAGGAGNASWNYYGVDLALYRLYYRTGLTAYLTYARQFTDYWWQWNIDHGRTGELPRIANMQAQYLRALDGHSERFPDLRLLAAYYENTSHITYPHDLIGTNLDVREAGYATWSTALGAIADPDSTRHTAYCTALGVAIPKWNTWQQPDGYWSENIYSYSDYPYLPPGTSPWRTDIPIHGLQAAYDVLNDTTSAGCNDQSLAATTLTSITKAVAWTYLAGRSDPNLGGNGGVYYDAAYETDGQRNPPITASGTVSVSLSSTTVTGSGTAFLSVFGSTGTRYIGFQSHRTVYKVTSSANDTTMTISPAFGSQGELTPASGESYLATQQAYTGADCASSATWCWNDPGDPPPHGDRNLTRLMAGMVGWLYNKTANPIYKTWGDQWFINSFGGPANGPGGSDPCNGVGCDGHETDWMGALPDCGISPNPPTICNPQAAYPQGNAFAYLGKNYGQGSGAPASQTYLAYRVSSPVSNAAVRMKGKVRVGGRVTLR